MPNAVCFWPDFHDRCLVRNGVTVHGAKNTCYTAASLESHAPSWPLADWGEIQTIAGGQDKCLQKLHHCEFAKGQDINRENAKARKSDKKACC